MCKRTAADSPRRLLPPALFSILPRMPDTTKTGAEGVTWNLGDLYASGADPRLDADLDAADRRADAFAAAYRGKVAGLSAEEMADLLTEYEAIARPRREGRLVRVPLLDHADRRPGPRRAAAEGDGARLAPAARSWSSSTSSGPTRPTRPPRRLIADPAARPAGATGWSSPGATGPTCSREPEEKILSEKSVTGRQRLDALLRRGARRPTAYDVGRRAGSRAGRAGEAVRGRPRGAPGRGRLGHERACTRSSAPPRTSPTRCSRTRPPTTGCGGTRRGSPRATWTTRSTTPRWRR